METSKCYWSGLPHLPGEPVAKHFPAHCQSRDSLLLLPTVPSLMIFNCMSDHLSSRSQNSSSSMPMPVFHFLAQSPRERQAQIFTVEPWLLLGCPSLLLLILSESVMNSLFASPHHFLPPPSLSFLLLESKDSRARLTGFSSDRTIHYIVCHLKFFLSFVCLSFAIWQVEVIVSTT